MAAISDVGRGKLGFSSRRRSYLDLASTPDAERLPRLSLHPGKTISGWAVHAGFVYKVTLAGTDLEFAGRVRAIVGVEAGVGQRRMTRVQRLADVVAGTWFYDEAAQSASGSTELYLQLSDSSNPSGTTVLALLSFQFGAVGEVVPVLGDDMLSDGGFEYWNSPTDAADYNEQNVGATGVAVDQETSNVVEGSSAIRISPGASGLAAGANGGANRTPITLVAGREYMVSVAYWTHPDLHEDLSARVRVRESPVGNTLAEDGDSTVASDAGCRCEPTYGEWARALFVFRCQTTATNSQLGVRLHNVAGAARSGGYVIFDDMHLWPILRYEYVEPAIAESSIPTQEVMSADALFGPKSMGVGTVKLLDGDGALATALARLDLFTRRAFAWSGGRFPGGDELMRDDWRAIFPALTRRPEVEDGFVTLQLEDARTLTRKRKAAAASARIADASNLEPTDENKPKPLLFGNDPNPYLVGLAVDVDANGYRYYETLDPRVPVADAVSVGLPTGWHVKSYPSKLHADLQQKGWKIASTITGNTVANPTVVTTSRRHGLQTGDSVTISGSNSTPTIDGVRAVTVTGDFTFTVAVNVTVAGTAGQVVAARDVEVTNSNTRFRVKRDSRDLQWDKNGDDVGSGVVFWFETEVTPGTTRKVELDLSGPPWLCCADLQAAMRSAIGGGDTATTVVYDESTHKVTVARAGVGKWINLFSNVANGAAVVDGRDGWKELGYNGKDKDHGGSATASWTAERPLFVDAEQDHVYRFPAGGYYDDASGSICGVASQPIDTYPAVASWCLQKVLAQPAATVDVRGTFASARDRCLSIDFSKLLWMVARGEEDVFKVLGICERGGVMDLVLEGRSDGSFVWRCVKYSTSTAGAVELFDRHYLTWRQWDDPDLAYKEVRLYGGQRPDLGRFMTWGAAVNLNATEMQVRFGADDRIFEVEAGVERAQIESGLYGVPGYYGRVIAAKPGLVKTSVRGLLINKLIGSKVILWRSRAFDPLGSFGMTPVAIASTNPVGDVFTTSTPHFLKAGQLVRVTGHSGSTPDVNADHRVAQVTGPTTFTVTTNITVGGTGGQLVRVPVHRIVGLSNDHSTGVSDVLLVDDIALV